MNPAPVRPLTVVVTRPAQEAVRWLHALEHVGHQAVGLPLLSFGPAPDVDAVARYRANIAQYTAVMFVSAQAVNGFFIGKNQSKCALAHDIDGLSAIYFDESAQPAVVTCSNPLPRAWVTGPGTARALIALGLEPSRIDQPASDSFQFDSEALWRVVQTQVRPGTRVLVVRGVSEEAAGSVGALPESGVGRNWLAQQCEGQGASVDFCVAYQRRPPAWSSEQLQTALTAHGPQCVWLFTNSEGVDHLSRMFPQRDWSHTLALATHPRIAQAAQALGFAEVLSSRPGLDDVLTALSGWTPA